MIIHTGEASDEATTAKKMTCLKSIVKFIKFIRFIRFMGFVRFVRLRLSLRRSVRCVDEIVA